MKRAEIEEMTIELITEIAGNPYDWIDISPETAKCSLMEIAAYIEYANKLKERLKDE